MARWTLDEDLTLKHNRLVMVSPGAAAVMAREGHELTSVEAELGPTSVATAKDESL